MFAKRDEDPIRYMHEMQVKAIVFRFISFRENNTIIIILFYLKKATWYELEAGISIKWYKKKRRQIEWKMLIGAGIFTGDASLQRGDFGDALVKFVDDFDVDSFHRSIC